ncbi:redox-sensitive transcriptional activator SoxR [Parendozoicomonas haliclonae]|uniref:Redox-sensitive transcriptional activator SoxR n=1 Tax=Parendozoicomonas haliclonae TaxID=1960125 RepID=A0A1X7AKC1_9GAMM|nr:redox-sensitive transcriptional activator SoxR [Parendozoicomonas haliclonae]SMA47127.1 Redox-sensitive transcriptional activator SoxR [Parendozoicomonas haliclonae]
MPTRFLTISEVARRCEVATSALRFYEKKGLISSVRTEGNQRRYHNAMVRRVSIIKAAQNLGLTLGEIAEAFENLPANRAPLKQDWEKLSSEWQVQLNERIDNLKRLRDKLSGCIGCGCLSLQACALFNPDDVAAESGPGPQFLMPTEESEATADSLE